MTVFLSTTDPGGDAEEFYNSRVFLIKAPDADGNIIYYLTKALKLYGDPLPEDNDGSETISEFFNRQPAGAIYLAADITPPNGVMARSEPQAQTSPPRRSQ